MDEVLDVILNEILSIDWLTIWPGKSSYSTIKPTCWICVSIAISPLIYKSCVPKLHWDNACADVPP